MTDLVQEIAEKNLKSIEERKIIEDQVTNEQMEVNLRRSEQRFKQIVENSSDFIWETDSKGLFTFCSESVQDILGYSTQELVGKNISTNYYLKNIGEN